MCGFDGIWRVNYFRGEPIGRVEVEVRMGKLKSGKGTIKDEITGEMIKGRGDKVANWNWRLCNKAFEDGIVPVPFQFHLCQGKELELSFSENIHHLLPLCSPIYSSYIPST